MIYIIIDIAVAIFQLLAVLILAYKYIKLRSRKDSEFYTDYRNGDNVIRIFKPEFEYQAIGDLNPYAILDRGNFSQFYFWALIDIKHESKQLKNNKNGNRERTRRNN